MTYGTVLGTVVDPVETPVQGHKGDQGEDERDDSEECSKPLYKDVKQASTLSASFVHVKTRYLLRPDRERLYSRSR